MRRGLNRGRVKNLLTKIFNLVDKQRLLLSEAGPNTLLVHPPSWKTWLINGPSIRFEFIMVSELTSIADKWIGSSPLYII